MSAVKSTTTPLRDLFKTPDSERFDRDFVLQFKKITERSLRYVTVRNE
jgi:hypothetical protein